MSASANRIGALLIIAAVLLTLCGSFTDSLAAKGYLRITLDQEGSSIYIDGKLHASNAPRNQDILIELDPGNYLLTFTKEGFSDERRSIAIASNEVRKVEITFRLVTDIQLGNPDQGTQVQAYGKLTILSTPPGAEIFLNGQRWQSARTPDTFEKVPTGSVRVGVRSADGITAEQMVEITKNQTAKVSFNLVPLYGFVTFQSDPPSARVEIPNILNDTTPLTEKVRTGHYTARVSAPGYLTETPSVPVEEEKNTVVRVMLKRDLGQLNIEPAEVGRSPRWQGTLDSKLLPEYSTRREHVKSHTGVWIYALSSAGVIGGFASANGDVVGYSFLGMIAGVGVMIYEKHAMTDVHDPNPENIARNRRLREEYQAALAYDAETDRLIAERRMEIRQEVEARNQQCQTTIEVLDRK